MKLRVARHTNQLEKLIHFYVTILDLEVLGEFKDHSGYDGAFIGRKEKDWQLEFTTTHEEVVHIFDEDDCLVFYPKTQNEFDTLVLRIQENKLVIRTPKNPYWKENGVLVHDPDGYAVILSPVQINP